MNRCCLLYRAVRWWKNDSPLARFTCPTCGRSYVRLGRGDVWREISTADDIVDMMKKEKERQT